MNKLIITITILISCMYSFAQTEEKILHVDIRGKDCRGGSGLCSILPKETGKIPHPFTTISKLSINTILLKLSLSNLSIEEQIKHFSKELSKINSNNKAEFIQDFDFILNEKMLLYLDINKKYCLLKKGKYPIEISNDEVLIIIKLDES